MKIKNQIIEVINKLTEEQTKKLAINMTIKMQHNLLSMCNIKEMEKIIKEYSE
jgi:ABC-type dipeptide/oligopeptide/nickel transport system ATPase component